MLGLRSGSGKDCTKENKPVAGPAAGKTLKARTCGDMVNVAENVSETFLMWFTMMFWVSVVSLVGVMLGGILHWVGNCAYFILIIVGSVYRWSATGKLCS